MIPAFLSIDVEPDGFQISRAAPPAWDGYAAMLEFAERLRSRLAERSGALPRIGWYFRTDPQIEEVYGRADHVLAEHPDRVARLRAHGDYFGVHAHLIRWCDRRRLWVHDVADAGWTSRCTTSSLEAYARWAGEPALRFRAGAAFLSNELVEAMHACGVAVDLTLEPVAGWALRATHVESNVDTSPIVGTYPDCSTAPRVPFRPAAHDFRTPGRRGGPGVVMVPLTSTTLDSTPRPRRGLLGRLWRRPSGPARMLYPFSGWPSPRSYWDLVERELRTMRRPYLSLAVRTDAADLDRASTFRRVFEALPEHPLAGRIRFVDPLDAIPSLL